MAAVFSTLSEFNNMAEKNFFFVKKRIKNLFNNNEVEDFFSFRKKSFVGGRDWFLQKKSKNFIEFKK